MEEVESEPLVVRIAHKLGKEEALRRIKPRARSTASTAPIAARVSSVVIPVKGKSVRTSFYLQGYIVTSEGAHGTLLITITRSRVDAPAFVDLTLRMLELDQQGEGQSSLLALWSIERPRPE